MTYEFSSSPLAGGKLITPEKIVINDANFIWSQNKGASRLFLAAKSITLSRKNINAVEINKKVIGSDLLVTTDGGSVIYASCFSKSDAEQIRQILLFRN